MNPHTIFSCKTQPDASRRYDKNVYHLRLNPPDGARYYYEADNESEVDLEVNGKK